MGTGWLRDRRDLAAGLGLLCGAGLADRRGLARDLDPGAAKAAVDHAIGELAVGLFVLDRQGIGVARVVDHELALAGHGIDAQAKNDISHGYSRW
jgi:hypothetical protein